MLDKAYSEFSKAMAKHVDFELWYLGLEEHHKIGVRNIAKEMIRERKPRWCPKWLWGRIIQ